MSSFSTFSEPSSTLLAFPSHTLDCDFVEEGTVFRPCNKTEKKENAEIMGELSKPNEISRDVLIAKYALLGVSILFFIQFVLAFFNLAFINGFVSLLAGLLAFGLFDVVKKTLTSFSSKNG